MFGIHNTKTRRCSHIFRHNLPFFRQFNLKPGREVGKIKKLIENAIIDGVIKNEYDDAFEYMQKITKKQN